MMILEDTMIDEPDSRQFNRFGQDYASRLTIYNKFFELPFVAIVFCSLVIFSFRCLIFLCLKYII